MDLDALSESARNRGLKLVRSRMRTPGRDGFGKVGLTDSAGKPVFGMEGKSLTATPDEAEVYLRGLNASDWGESLRKSGASVRKRSGEAAGVKSEPPQRVAPPKPVAVPAVRRATVGDVAALTPLMGLLGYAIDASALKRRLKTLIDSGDAPFVATLDKAAIGLCGVQVSTMLQRERPVGRLTILVVAEDMRGKAVGRMLVEAAEEHFRLAGCELIEVTSNDKHLGAHAFYRRLGYERTSIRFAKTL